MQFELMQLPRKYSKFCYGDASLSVFFFRIRLISLFISLSGIIATPMMSQIEAAAGKTEFFGSGDPGALARKGDAEEVAAVVVFLLSDQSSFVNGVVLPVDGGWMC